MDLSLQGGVPLIGEQVLLSTVFIAGLLSFFAPCILPLLPVYISVLSSNDQNAKGSNHFITIGKLKINLHLLHKTIVFVLEYQLALSA